MGVRKVTMAGTVGTVRRVSIGERVRIVTPFDGTVGGTYGTFY